MFVCSCEVVNDRTIVAAIENGALTVDEVAAACRAGSNCGDCRPAIQQLIDEARTLRPGSPTTPPGTSTPGTRAEEAAL